MKKTPSGQYVFSPSDLVTYISSPFASWMDRYYLEYPDVITPDEQTEDEKLIAQTGIDHERMVLEELKCVHEVVEVDNKDAAGASAMTLHAIESRASIIYQAALKCMPFAGFADFLLLNDSGEYQVWDTKLARSPKPYYAVQLCCYSEMLAAMTRRPMPEKFGIILGSKERVEFRVEDFIYYYRNIKKKFLEMQGGFTTRMEDRPEPFPNANHGRWTSHAEEYFRRSDNLVKVAGITIAQIKKLNNAGIQTMAELAAASGIPVRKLNVDTLEKIVAQAKLQCLTRDDRKDNPDAPPRYEVLPQVDKSGRSVGLAVLPPEDNADVFFDMEGYPLAPGGLEYLFGACTRTALPEVLEFKDWWAHDREEEKIALEGFVDWVYGRWQTNPNMHIYHYAAYEVSAVRRLSTRHDTRQDEVDMLLRRGVFVDLYKIVRHGLQIGEESYSIKSVEHLYRSKRATEVATAIDSVVQYARWMESMQPRNWEKSAVLKNIRDYNEDDCKSTAELAQWLRTVAAKHNIAPFLYTPAPDTSQRKEIPPEDRERLEIAEKLRKQEDTISVVLADVIDFHRREDKPVWWQFFDRSEATPEELRDDAGCIFGVQAIEVPTPVKRSLMQKYVFDPTQECKLAASEKSLVAFQHNTAKKFSLVYLDLLRGELQIKISQHALDEDFQGKFPQYGSLLPYEIVPADVIKTALAEVAGANLSNNLPAPVGALLNRVPPATPMLLDGEDVVTAATRITDSMSGGCLVIQGPPGTGKTYTASHVIVELIKKMKRVGITSNSRKAIINLIAACGKASSGNLKGVLVGAESDELLFAEYPNIKHAASNSTGHAAYHGGIIGGTAWLFTRPEWENELDYLFIDEAGQVSLANAIAMSRCSRNLVLLGDQMQLEQPVKGSHPGDSGLSVLQYALKDTEQSKPDQPEFYPVIPPDYGLFLNESRRMHPSVCQFISESIYEGRLKSYDNCARQKIAAPENTSMLITRESGIVFVGVEHDGNIQQSDEEVERVVDVYNDLFGRLYTDQDGTIQPLVLADFLFIAPYNAQVRALKAALPKDARVGSVDKFQGQEAPVCILSLCCSYGEYGSRGLSFILDRNRLNVAISRAKCLAVIVADPRIALTNATSLEDMKMINMFCKIAGI